MQIAAVGRALPDHYYDQETLMQAMLFMWDGESHTNLKRMETLHKHVEVGGRYLSIRLDEYLFTRSFGQANDHYIRVATDVGERAVREAMDRACLRPEEVGAFIFVSVTGVATPSIDARLMNRIELPSSTKRMPIFGLGCVAGAAGTARAADYVRAYPDQAVLMLSVELCSLTLQKEDFSIANLIVTGLFGDGAACAVVAGEGLAPRLADRMRERNDADADGADDAAFADAEILQMGPKILDTRSIFYPDTERVMGWDISEKGFEIVLSSGVPDVARRFLPGDVDRFLAEHGLTREDMACWVCHPGGPKVIGAIQQGLRLSDEQVGLSRKSLREVGNMSSTSVLMVLRETMDSARPAPGAYGLMLAMGPGFCSELVLLRW